MGWLGGRGRDAGEELFTVMSGGAGAAGLVATVAMAVPMMATPERLSVARQAEYCSSLVVVAGIPNVPVRISTVDVDGAPQIAFEALQWHRLSRLLQDATAVGSLGCLLRQLSGTVYTATGQPLVTIELDGNGKVRRVRR